MTLASANVFPTSSAIEREPTQWSLQATWADSEADVRAAQALRFDVFAAELGAQLPAAAVASRLDADRFDPHCDHLLVWAVDPYGQQPSKLVGTYRVLPPAAARLLGGLYAEQEFDLSPLDFLRPRMVELGRACVHADWRSGGAILMLWSALGRYMVRRQFDTMTGCASIGLADRGQFAAAVWHSLQKNHLAVPRWRVTPRTPLPLCALDPEAVPLSMRAMPPLIKGYLRGGACVLGAPAYDPCFHTADFPIMMRLADLTPRYRAQFLLP
ncbi:MAG: GNAT family N-acetyltransferase [Pseudomonadota bacterium]|nr:GNAT family N-acetyltransferase [Pseudomonadota bacterium]